MLKKEKDSDSDFESQFPKYDDDLPTLNDSQAPEGPMTEEKGKSDDDKQGLNSNDEMYFDDDFLQKETVQIEDILVEM